MSNAYRPFRIGLIGTGRISDIYIQTCSKFDELEIVSCGSLDPEESQKKAQMYGIPKVQSPEEILADPDVECILNLTIPASHASVTLQSLEAGKHVYSEKPFATDVSDCRRILELARSKKLKVGNAPDTFFGGRWQTVRKLLDQQVIGKPAGVMAFAGTHGVERHHPNPDFYYQTGGGPLLDLGPYYLTAMVFLLGPISKVSGLARKTFDQRVIENGNRYGEKIKVEVDTHSLSMLEFQNGAIGSMTLSFDIWDSETPRLEIYGENGTICIPDPDPVHGANIFQGPVLYRTRSESRWEFQPRPKDRGDWLVAENTHGFNRDSRGVGLLDLYYAVRDDRAVRASAELAAHVSEVMQGILDAPGQGGFVAINSTCDVPEILPENFPTSESPDHKRYGL
ncbi:MAG: Gfo/Idh/MocA family oxidoreductase [Paracoccaceae bacterium]|nr:Gfo/Idh/MocA family oxidoreductase [Paracoccaceae bacterium]